MADDAPTAPSGRASHAASRHDSSSEAFRVGVQPEGTDDGALQPRGHALDDHESRNTPRRVCPTVVGSRWDAELGPGAPM